MEETREQIAAAIVKFARDNNLYIHPGQEPLRWSELVIKKGGCPCVPGRTHCPCEFALDDIKELNRCRCGLFCNGAYIEQYNNLKAKQSQAKIVEEMGAKAKGEFLKKISINGFSIAEHDNELTLRPRGIEEATEITIKETEPGVWKVTHAIGRYAGFSRGKKRSYFESYINQWAAEASLRAAG